jgi:hypothetical protein
VAGEAAVVADAGHLCARFELHILTVLLHGLTATCHIACVDAEYAAIIPFFFGVGEFCTLTIFVTAVLQVW